MTKKGTPVTPNDRAVCSSATTSGPYSSLADLAAGSGLDRDQALSVLAGDDYGPDVDADEQTARSFGVSGVPFFVIDRHYGISGAQPPEVIVQVLDRAWAEAESA